MTAAASLVLKEARPLVAVWLSSLAVLGVSAFSGQTRTGLVAWVAASAAIGALSIGHEYGHRTLPLALSLPITRSRLFLAKIGTLGAMLLTMWIVVGVSFPLVALERYGLGLWYLPLACGLFLAPWLTMICRSTLGGMVFAIALPTVVWLLADTAATFVDPTTAQSSAVTLFLGGMSALVLAGAIGSWRGFMRLEAIDGRGADLALPSWPGAGDRSAAGASTRPRRRPMRALLVKELHLQQMSFVIAVLFVIAWPILIWLRTTSPAYQGLSMEGIATFYGAFIALFAGSLASAEERQLGTIEGQLLLPVSTSRQWLVKVVTAIGVALLLAMAVPALLDALFPSREWERPWQSPRFLLLTSFAAGALYVSSVSSSGLRALVGALFVVPVATATFLSVLASLPYQMWWLWQQLELSGLLPVNFAPTSMRTAMRIAGTGLALSVVAVALWFAYRNHRSLDRPRIWRQAAWLVVAFAGLASVWAIVFQLLRVGVISLG